MSMSSPAWPDRAALPGLNPNGDTAPAVSPALPNILCPVLRILISTAGEATAPPPDRRSGDVPVSGPILKVVLHFSLRYFVEKGSAESMPEGQELMGTPPCPVSDGVASSTMRNLSRARRYFSREG